ncbi:antitoxin [archaeon]|nr:antitoxin [archaeon]|tara:strand:+ start:1514 stop:1750 length:237 start_codon:yes stop_codon:yes gene_type:complete
MRIEINKQIVIDSEICHGKPTFKGNRIMVWQIFEMLEAGMSLKEIREGFPSINSKHIRAALHYATNITKGKNNVLIPA